MRPHLAIPAACSNAARRAAFALLLLGPAACAPATPPDCVTAPVPTFATSEAAAIALLDGMNMGPLIDQMVEQVLDAQIEQAPQIAHLKAPMRRFFQKYMSWESLRPAIVKMYTEAYTKSELEELVAFYRTDVGRKSIEVMPKLMKEGGELGAQRVREHLGELQEMLTEHMDKPE